MLHTGEERNRQFKFIVLNVEPRFIVEFRFQGVKRTLINGGKGKEKEKTSLRKKEEESEKKKLFELYLLVTDTILRFLGSEKSGVSRLVLSVVESPGFAALLSSASLV